MPKVSRRDFFKNSSALAAAAALAGSLDSRLLAKEPNLQFPTEPRARLAVASWPFRAFIEAPDNRWARNPKLPGMDLKDFAAMVVKRFNVRGIEPLNSHFRSTEPAYLAEFRKSVEDAGAHVVDVPVDGPFSYYDPDPAKRKQAIDFGKKWIDIAVAIGSPSIRSHVARARAAKPDVDLTSECLKQIADYGAEKNVLVNLENDDPVSEDPFFIVKVIEKVNHPYLHALPDFCNSMMGGDADFDLRAMKAMFPHAYNISHMKDEEGNEHGKFYQADVNKTFAIAKAAGYRGYFSMEWEGNGEPYAGTQRLIDESLKNLS